MNVLGVLFCFMCVNVTQTEPVKYVQHKVASPLRFADDALKFEIFYLVFFGGKIAENLT